MSLLPLQMEAQILEAQRIQFDRFFIDLCTPQKLRQVLLLPACYDLLKNFLQVLFNSF